MRAMSWRPALFLRKGTSLTFSSNFALGSYPVLFFAAAMPVTLAAAMAVIPLRTVRRVSFMGSSCRRILCLRNRDSPYLRENRDCPCLFDLDVGGPDDRPPLLGL